MAPESAITVPAKTVDLAPLDLATIVYRTLCRLTDQNERRAASQVILLALLDAELFHGFQWCLAERLGLPVPGGCSPSGGGGGRSPGRAGPGPLSSTP